LDEARDDETGSALLAQLESLVWRFGSWLTQAIGDMHEAGEVGGRALREVLPLLGEIDHPGSHVSRCWLLKHCLADADPWVRSGAALGLAELRDPGAIPYLRRQARVEEFNLLRERLLQVAEELGARATRSGVSS
jgi:hypothetical protein